jgi:hypothetical protein
MWNPENLLTIFPHPELLRPRTELMLHHPMNRDLIEFPSGLRPRRYSFATNHHVHGPGDWASGFPSAPSDEVASTNMKVFFL